jgi:2-dehydropantoate 2-reductase
MLPDAKAKVVCMRHAVLGAGGVGGLLAAALARNGSDVVVLMRLETIARYDGCFAVESAALGDFAVGVRAAPALDAPVDVLWVATKATQLEPALELAPRASVGDALVIPLLNGIDHVARLREIYPNVIAATIRVESERVGPGRIRQPSPFASIDLAGAEAVASTLRAAGFDCTTTDDETTLLWTKLAFLAPLALATGAVDGPLGSVRDDPRFLGCRSEVLAVARAEGATIDEAGLISVTSGVPDSMRTSLQKDVAAGREPELDAIAGPVIRGGGRHGIPVPSTRELARLVGERAGKPAPG